MTADQAWVTLMAMNDREAKGLLAWLSGADPDLFVSVMGQAQAMRDRLEVATRERVGAS